MPATGDGHPGGSRDPLGVPEPPVRRACAVLHLSGDRVFRRRGVRGRRRMVEAGLHAAPPVGPETAPFLSFRSTGLADRRKVQIFPVDGYESGMQLQEGRSMTEPRYHRREFLA